ncbi:AAA family ATPase [Roseivirga sp. BDSF3-8]|uniref:AAA family ATPase n=1 Tax=Roseivirga sp. BDSF3-8 TaxID=3241598 RepID=UPI00353211FA
MEQETVTEARETAAVQSTIQVRDKTARLIKALTKGLYEREEVIKLSLLAAVAGESIFLLGPPGVGKSLIARRLKHAFRDGKSFEYLMSRFSTPDEVFGPISIQKLREEDRYERKTDQYLPGANVVFLDEIWKSSPAIQNALLTILNEKIYRNGEQEMKVDLHGIIAASNELPPEGESFEPLWDRFLIRYKMDGIQKSRNFLRMITDTQDVYEVQVAPQDQISNSELKEWSKAIDQVEVPDEVLDTIQVIRKKVEDYNTSRKDRASLVLTYDRRWKKIIRLMRTSAFLNDRPKADLMDCFLIIHCLWNKPGQEEVIREIVGESIRKHGYSLTTRLSMLKKETEAFDKEVDGEIRIRNTVTREMPKPYEETYFELVKDSSQFDGKYIRINDFHKLSREEFTVTNFYDEENNLVNRLETKKGLTEHTVLVKYSSVEYSFSLITMKQEETEMLMKKPHRLVQQFWNERYEKLHGYILQQIDRLEAESPEELDQVETNLFIDHRLAPIVTANHREVTEALHRVRLQLEQIKYSYDNIS